MHGTLGLMILCVGVLGCAALGCEAKPRGSLASQAAQRYVDLPGLRSSANAQLQAELELLVQEQATPAQLTAAQRSVTDVAYGSDPPLVQLKRAFPAFSRNMLSGQIDAVYPQERVRLGPAERERAREVLRRQAQARETFRLALPGKGQCFGVPLDQGLLVDLEFLDPLEIGCRLEILDAADDLSDHRLDDATDSLEVLLQATQALAAEKNVTTRVAAIPLRADALRLLETISTHRFVSPARHEYLLTLLQTELAHWPPDADAWIGDRALGLHTYELVRDGNFLSLLDREEAERLEARGLLKSTAQAAWKNVDADELFYLQAMRQMIDSCRLPYYQRVDVLKQIRSDLTAREETAEYPLVAATILLTDFEHIHRQQAEDLARVQAWQFALSVALKRASPDAPPVNPVTGQPFSTESDGRRFVVSNILPEQDVSITLRIHRNPALAQEPEFAPE